MDRYSAGILVNPQRYCIVTVLTFCLNCCRFIIHCYFDFFMKMTRTFQLMQTHLCRHWCWDQTDYNKVLIGHFRVAQASVSRLFSCKKTHFTRKVLHVASFWKWEVLELGNGLLHLAFPPIFVFLLSTTKAVSPAHLILIFAPFSSQEHYPLILDSAAGSLRVVIVSLSSRLLFFCIPPKEFARNILFPRPFKILRSNCLLQCKQ